MKILPKKFVYYVERKPHWLSNRQGYFTMERNERVDDFPKSFMKKIKNEVKSFDLRTYPDTHLIYKEVAKWLKVKNDQIIILITDGENRQGFTTPLDEAKKAKILIENQ